MAKEMRTSGWGPVGEARSFQDTGRSAVVLHEMGNYWRFECQRHDHYDLMTLLEDHSSCYLK